MSFVSFPKIKQFKDVIISVRRRGTFSGLDGNGEPIYDNSIPLPTISFLGTTKMHGTNAAISRAPDGSIHVQSRNNIIDPENDNFGFARFINDVDSKILNKLFLEFVEPMIHGINPNNPNRLDVAYPAQRVTLFGEWIGQGVGGAGVRQIQDRSFVIFGVYVGERGQEAEGEDPDGFWIPIHTVPSFKEWEFNEHHIYLITDLSPIFNIDIDFNYPQLSQNKLIELTLEIERSCPVAKAMGVDGIGEGIVWRPITDGWEDSDYWFKVKGDQHSATKVKTLAQIDPTKVNNTKEFVEETVTENRLRQALDYLSEMGKPISRASTGDFVRWVINDISTEAANTMEANGLVTKDVASNVGNAARQWFFRYLDTEV